MSMDHLSPEETKKGSTIGMWLFLYTEIMLFGGLFVVYANYYYTYNEGFLAGAQELDLFFGALNTVVLLISSFTVAAAVGAVHHGLGKRAKWLLITSILLGFVFLINKYFEWSHKFDVGIYPGSDRLAEGPYGELVFFGLYYTLTGLHALHVIIGLSLLAFCWLRLSKARDVEGVEKQGIIVHNSGLYWHLVDLIWIFLFPLLYLIL